MIIEYTYKVISVDAERKFMEMEFSSEGKKTVLVGARLPYEGETVEDVAAHYAPVHQWEHDSKSVIVPEVGATGKSSNSVSYQNELSKTEESIANRNFLLLRSDWTQLSDVDLTAEQKQAWAVYRQALRDITEQAGFPETIDWPVPPQ
jgi:hypothetical protein